MGEEVTTLTFAPDGATLALTVKDNGSVRLWDIAADPPRERASLPAAMPLPGLPAALAPVAVAFAPDGKTLAVVEVALKYSVRLWDLTGPGPTEAATARDRDQFDESLGRPIGHLRPGWQDARSPVRPTGRYRRGS